MKILMFQRWLRFYMYIYAMGIDVFKRLRDNNWTDFFSSIFGWKMMIKRLREIVRLFYFILFFEVEILIFRLFFHVILFFGWRCFIIFFTVFFLLGDRKSVSSTGQRRGQLSTATSVWRCWTPPSSTTSPSGRLKSLR